MQWFVPFAWFSVVQCLDIYFLFSKHDFVWYSLVAFTGRNRVFQGHCVHLVQKMQGGEKKKRSFMMKAVHWSPHQSLLQGFCGNPPCFTEIMLFICGNQLCTPSFISYKSETNEAQFTKVPSALGRSDFEQAPKN